MTTTDAGTGEPPATPLRRWLSRRTLRGRLIAGLLALLAVACAAVGLTSYFALQHAMMSQLDGQLAAASMRYGNCLESGPPDTDSGRGGEGGPPRDTDHDNDNLPGGPAMCGQEQGGQTFSAAIGNSVVRYPTVAGGDCHLSPADKAALTALRTSHGPVSVSLSALGPYQLMASPGRSGDVLVTGLPLSPVQSTLRDVELTEAIVFSAALVLTGLVGMGLVRLSLRPLRRVAATAGRVAQLPLASGEVVLPERVPDANPRTEVGQVGLAFNRMLGHVEWALGRRAASEARLRRFAADASHELRTPLAAIRGYAELGRRQGGPVPAQVGHALERVEAESSRMSVLVDELLLLAQLDAGRPLAHEPVDVCRLAVEVSSDARVAAPGHRWLLDLPAEPVVVAGDEHRLHQVLANLLSNAAKHTPPGTTVITTARTTPATSGGDGGDSPGDGGVGGGPGRGGTATLTVTDNGPGIPPALQPTLFERFVRGDTARTHTPAGATTSSGLGLAIVDAVTTAHGGTVHLDSHPGHTQFTITLPHT
jgi:two-component system, OmpR family, sensor kinase